MSNDLNRCMFIGRLTKDVETRYLPNGDAVSNFSIASNWKTKTKEGAEFINIVAFGKLGEICGQYLQKGKQVFIEGSMRTRTWEDQSGAKRYTTEITASNMQMLGGKGEAQQQGGMPTANDFEDDIAF